MDTSSIDDGPPADAPGDDSEAAPKWIVRIFLVLSFGLAFGIEGMTLIRSYVFEDDEEATVQRTDSGTTTENNRGRLVGVGDELLLETVPSEQVSQTRIRARTDASWAFRLAIRIENDSDERYRLTVRSLETADGSVNEQAHSVECAPGDTTRLVASWPIAADTQPHSLTAVGETLLSADSIRTVEERVRFGHVPVQMIR